MCYTSLLEVVSCVQMKISSASHRPGHAICKRIGSGGWQLPLDGEQRKQALACSMRDAYTPPCIRERTRQSQIATKQVIARARASLHLLLRHALNLVHDYYWQQQHTTDC